MRKVRGTEKGRAYVKEYNKRYKRVDIEKVCSGCQGDFITARKDQELCSICSVSYGACIAQKKYRAGNGKKVRARGVANKRVQRGVSMFKDLCVVCGKEAEMHHADYNKPLGVIWLCRKHHAELHKAV